MLKQMREGSKSQVLKITLFGMLLLAMAGLALMDVQGMFRAGAINNTIVSFGRDKVSAPEFDRMVQSTIRNEHMKQSDAYRAGLPQQILKQEIDTRIFAMAANDLGLDIDDATAAKQIKQMLSPLVQKGMSEKDAFDRMLQVYGYSEGQLVSMLKSQIATQEVVATLTAGTPVPQQLVKDLSRYRNEWRRGDYIRLTADDAGAAAVPTEDDLKAYYDSISHDYALPEYRTLSVITLDKSILGDDAKISDDRLKQYYEENISDYSAPETRVISQVVVDTRDAAKKVYDAAIKSKDLQAAATEAKASFLKAGTFTQKEMPVELSKAAFTAPAGSILPPAQSPLGWHVLYIEKVNPGAVKPFESVKAEIEKDMSQDKISQALYEKANKIDDEIAGGKSVADVAKENNIHETVLDKIDVRGMDASGHKPADSIPLYDKVVDNGFSLKEGTASPLIETPDGAFVIVGVKNVYPSEQQPFAKVRGDVLSRWKNEHLAKALSDKAAKILDRLNHGETLAKVAADLGKSVQSTDLIKRTSTPLQVHLDSATFNALFSLEHEGAATTVPDGNMVTILRLAERKVQKPEEADEDKKLSAMLDHSTKDDILSQFRLALIDKYDVDINTKLLQTMYAPKDDNSGEEN